MKNVIYDLSMINNAMHVEHEAYYVQNEKTLGRLDPHMLRIVIYHSEAVHFFNFLAVYSLLDNVADSEIVRM